MNKITIIGLGLVGNSIGMALKRAISPQGSSTTKAEIEIVGLDPDRQREADAVRKFGSVDSIADNLAQAVEGAELIIIATPASAAREVMEAIDPYLAEGVVVTDTLSSKEQVMRWAGETLGREVSFIGGHPIIADDNPDDLSDKSTPSADLFRNARWAIIPRPGASNDALNTVIWLAETVGASPLFIDPFEHDSYLAAVSHLPMVAGAALWRLAHSSPSWGDMESFAQSGFKNATESLSAPPEIIAASLAGNRRVLLGWVDRYLLSLQEMRDMLAQGSELEESGDPISATLAEAHKTRRAWITESSVTGDEKNERLRAELHAEIDEARPTRYFMGSYLAERLFKKKEK
ncbi:MAG TPA: prephenate dehydrogenase [Chloroflexia bacterium]|nr:prephenate dehydrogenase [Chloroflexia bacterium]